MISVEQLQERLNCGYKTAVTIGKDAKARVSVGRRVFYLSLIHISAWTEQLHGQHEPVQVLSLIDQQKG